MSDDGGGGGGLVDGGGERTRTGWLQSNLNNQNDIQTKIEQLTQYLNIGPMQGKTRFIGGAGLSADGYSIQSTVRLCAPLGLSAELIEHCEEKVYTQ